MSSPGKFKGDHQLRNAHLLLLEEEDLLLLEEEDLLLPEEEKDLLLPQEEDLLLQEEEEDLLLPEEEDLLLEEEEEDLLLGFIPTLFRRCPKWTNVIPMLSRRYSNVDSIMGTFHKRPYKGWYLVR